MIKLHKNENDNDNDDDNNSEFTHACIIIIFFLINLLYLLIHSLNYLFKFIQFYSVFINIMNFVTMLSLINYCL